MINNFEELRNTIKAVFKEAVVEIQVFDSGNIVLDVAWRNKLFILCIFSNNQFGVAEITEDNESFDMHFDFMTKDFTEAKTKLFNLLNNSR